MATLLELALSTKYPYGMILDDSDVEQQAINAAQFYLGHGRIAALDGPATFSNPTDALFTPLNIPYLGPSDAPGVIFAGLDYGPDTRLGGNDVPPLAPDPEPVPPGVLSADTVISPSEWSIIRRLYLLYVERENSRALEASRMQGIEVFGRDVASVESDIERYETETLPRMAFSQLAETI
jgi:hypothetical protein